MKEFNENPQEFIDNIEDLQHHIAGWMACLEQIQTGKIKAEEFDTEAQAWIETNSRQMERYAEIPNDKRLISLGYKIRNVLFVVTNKIFTFPKSLAVFKKNKEVLLAISVTNDGGHWENSVKLILRKLTG